MDTTGAARILATAAVLAGAMGCAAGTRQLQTPHYTLSHPDFWKVRKQAAAEGEPTIIVIPQYGDAVIDDGAGALASRGASYEAVTADVEVRIHAWKDPGDGADPTQRVATILERDPELQLVRHHRVLEHPPECGVLPRKYTVFGAQQAPLDLVSRPGWRTIVVGGRAGGVLLGAVSRVEYEQDMGRFCHNLRNMQVQLQNLLDALVVGPPRPGGGTTP